MSSLPNTSSYLADFLIDHIKSILDFYEPTVFDPKVGSSKIFEMMVLYLSSFRGTSCLPSVLSLITRSHIAEVTGSIERSTVTNVEVEFFVKVECEVLGISPF